MQDYKFLKPERAHQLRMQRYLELEEDHFHALLLHEETPADRSCAKVIAELERRLEHHARVLGLVGPATEENVLPPQDDDDSGEPG